jgi:hypothetical protein
VVLRDLTLSFFCEDTYSINKVVFCMLKPVL